MQFWLGIAFLLAIIVAVALLRLNSRKWRVDTATAPLPGVSSSLPVLPWLRDRGGQKRAAHAFTREQTWAWLAPGLQLGAIIGFAVWLGRDFLSAPLNYWPLGSDFMLNVQGYYGWPAFWQCGLCVLWNGSVNGGAPLFAELLAAVAHPLVVAFVLLWGVIGGLKVTAVAGLALAGLAQWWLAKSLRLGVIACMWSAAMAMVGGHLAARLEEGLIEEVFAAASCGLVIPAALNLIDTGSRRAVVIFGGVLALALLAGQGYMQIGMLLGIMPALLLLLLDTNLRWRPVWRPLVLGVGLALLLTAFYWVPFLHFLPGFAKMTDVEFTSAEALTFLPLNLVIRDYQFYSSEVFGQVQQAHLYANYVGWVPVLLALLALRLVPRAGQRKLLFFLAAIFLTFVTASSLPFRLIASLPVPFLADFAAGVRYPSEMSSLVITPLLAIAAWGLDRLLKADWPRLSLSFSPSLGISLSLAWLLALPLAGAVYSAYDFGRAWLITREVPEDYFRIIPQIKLATAGWVEPPSGDSGFSVVALNNGFKITNTFRPWSWRDRQSPPPVLRTTREPVDAATPGYQGQIDYLGLIAQPAHAYAALDTNAGLVPCTATAVGGNIDVTCQSDQAGQLTVLENAWSGWSVTRDGLQVPLTRGDYLSVPVPAGTHVLHFRYRPWDVALGVGLSLLGVLGGVALLRRWRWPFARAAAQR